MRPDDEPPARLLAEGDRAYVLMRRGGRWRPFGRLTGPDAQGSADRLVSLINDVCARFGGEDTAESQWFLDVAREYFAERGDA